VTQRKLIVNADDFGLSAGVNRGVLEAEARGVVTSASLLVRRPNAREAAEAAGQRPHFSLGLHFDLGEWVYRGGEWLTVYEVVPTTDASSVGEELERQLEAFRRMTGVQPTHLDSHQHVHRSEPARGLVLEAAHRLGVPVRALGEAYGGVRYCGDFFGQTGKGEPYPEGISVDHLLGILDGLEPGTTELGCHPGADDDAGPPYSAERTVEFEVLCDRRVRSALEDSGVELISFHDLKEGAYASIG
jgi:predicted glycoside hydrolase/deacetylase ChbG (UPF0249 family)